MLVDPQTMEISLFFTNLMPKALCENIICKYTADKWMCHVNIIYAFIILYVCNTYIYVQVFCKRSYPRGPKYIRYEIDGVPGNGFYSNCRLATSSHADNTMMQNKERQKKK